MAYLNKADQAANAAKHYQANKEKIKARAKAYKDEQRLINKEYITTLKAKTPCADCNKYYHPVMMDFDHLGDDKEKDISKAVHLPWTLERLIKEVDKCQLVCSNCHRLRTLLRREGFTF